MEDQNQVKYLDKFNIMVIGDEKVGKTTLLERYFKGKFNSERKKTVGVEYYHKDYTNNKKETYNIKFWDTAGQEKFRSVTKNYYQRAHGMIITMSVDYKTSFDNLLMWINSVKENSGNENLPIVICCNKIDLPEEEREVDLNEVSKVCTEEHKNIKMFFTSAKNGNNINESFEYIIEKVIKENTVNNDKNVDLNSDTQKPSRCC